MVFDLLLKLPFTDVPPEPTINNATFAVNEWVATTTDVGTPTTTDPAGGGLTFAITAGNTGTAFSINSSTGLIRTAALLNNATLASYSLTVEITDALMRTAHATITVNVTAYSTRVTAIANLIQYLKQNETSGTDAFDYSAAGTRDGVYSGATLNTGAVGFNNDPVPVYDGVNDYLNCASAAFNVVFNGSEGSYAIWVKPIPAAFWSGAPIDLNFIALRNVATTSVIRIRKTAVNTITFEYIIPSFSKSISVAATWLTWTHIALTWSASADQVKAYINGVQVGSTQTGLGVWSGAPDINQPTIAARTTGAGFGNIQAGHEAWYTRALTLAEIQSLAAL